MEVEADGCKDGVDAIAVASFEVIAAHSVFDPVQAPGQAFEVTDNGFDRGASFHLAFDGGGGPADLAVIQTRRREL